jgi:hypothetical protein
MISWVVLSKTRVELSLDSLRGHLDRLYPGLFLPPQDRKNFVIDGVVPGAQFLIQASVAGSVGLYMLHNVAANYTEFSDFADGVSDASLRKSILEQEAWLSVDLIEAAPDQDCHRFIGKVLGALAPANSTILVDPHRRMAIRFDEELRGQLMREEFPGGFRRITA